MQSNLHGTLELAATVPAEAGETVLTGDYATVAVTRNNYYTGGNDDTGEHYKFDFTGSRAGLLSLQAGETLSTTLMLPAGDTISTTYHGTTGQQPGALERFTVESWAAPVRVGTAVSYTGVLSDLYYADYGFVKNPDAKTVTIIVEVVDTADSQAIAPMEDATFDTLQLGYRAEQMQVLDIAIKNTGDGDLHGLSVVLSGDNADAFSIYGQPAALLGENGSTTLSLTTKHGLPAGEYTATATVYSDTNEPLGTFPIYFKVSDEMVYKVIAVACDPSYGGTDVGTVSLPDGNNHNAGATVRLEAIPVTAINEDGSAGEAYGVFEGWEIVSAPSGFTLADIIPVSEAADNTQYAFTMPDGNLQLRAVFSETALSKMRLKTLRAYAKSIPEEELEEFQELEELQKFDGFDEFDLQVGSSTEGYTFTGLPATATGSIVDKILTGIEALTAPNKSFSYSDAWDAFGITTIKLTYDDGTTEDLTITSADFANELNAKGLKLVTIAEDGTRTDLAATATIPLNGQTLMIVKTDDAEITNGSLGTLTVTPKAVTITSVTGLDNKTYNRDVDASGTMVYTTTPAVLDSSVAVRATVEYVDANVGTNKAVKLTEVALTGNDAGNYSIAASFDNVSSTNLVTAKRVTVTKVTGLDSREYNGTVDASGTLTYETDSDALLTADGVYVTGLGVKYVDPNKGTGKKVKLDNGILVQNEPYNYSISGSQSGIDSDGDITAKVVTITAVTGLSDRPYDDTDTTILGTPVYTLDGVLAAEQANVTATVGEIVYAGKNAGANTVNLATVTLDGVAAGNYSIATSFNNISSTGAIIKATPAAPAAPSLEVDRKTNNIKVTNSVATQEYRISTDRTFGNDPEAGWGDETEFGALAADTPYYVQTRAKGTDNYNASPSSANADATTYEFVLTIKDKDENVLSTLYHNGTGDTIGSVTLSGSQSVADVLAIIAAEGVEPARLDGYYTDKALGTAFVDPAVLGMDADAELFAKIKAAPIVTPPSNPPTSVTISPNAISGVIGDKKTVTATILPANANQAMAWSTSDSAVATVNQGVITFVGAGTATITVKTVNGLSATITVTSLEEGQSMLDKNYVNPYVFGYEDDSFRPENHITRAEVAAMFSRLMTQKMDVDATYETGFTDINSDQWFYKNIAFLEGLGVLQGMEIDGEKCYKPEASMTRAELAVMLARIEGIVLDENETYDFADADEIPAWAKPAVMALANLGIYRGYDDNTFRAEDNITRAEMVSLLNRLLKVMKTEEAARFPNDVTDEHWAYADIIKAMNDRTIL